MLKEIINAVVITILIFAVAVFFPIIGFFCALFIPLPIFFYHSKLGRHTGAIIAVLAFTVMLIIIGRVSIDVVFFGGLILIGFVLGELVRFNFSIEKTVVYACGSVLLTGFIGLLVLGSVSSKGIYQLLSEYVANNLELSLAIYQNMGMSEENIQLLANSLDKIQYVLVRIIPSLVAASTLFVVWSNLLMAKPLLAKRALFYPDFGPLNLWKSPDYLVWGVIACGLVLFLPSTGFKILGINGLLIFMTIYFFQGIAIVSYFFERKGFPRLLRFFLYSLIALQQILLLAVVGLGFFDMWLNFRKLGKQNSLGG